MPSAWFPQPEPSPARHLRTLTPLPPPHTSFPANPNLATVTLSPFPPCKCHLILFSGPPSHLPLCPVLGNAPKFPAVSQKHHWSRLLLIPDPQAGVKLISGETRGPKCRLDGLTRLSLGPGHGDDLTAASSKSGHWCQLQLWPPCPGRAPRLTVFTKAQSQWEPGFHSFTSNSSVLASARLKRQN